MECGAALSDDIDCQSQRTKLSVEANVAKLKYRRRIEWVQIYLDMERMYLRSDLWFVVRVGQLRLQIQLKAGVVFHFLSAQLEKQ